jgi:anti-anti-sigma factor
MWSNRMASSPSRPRPSWKARLDAAIETGKGFVVVDLGEVRLVDAPTLGVMLLAQRRLEAHGGRLVTICSDRRLARVFEITGRNEWLSAWGEILGDAIVAATLDRPTRPPRNDGGAEGQGYRLRERASSVLPAAQAAPRCGSA